MRTPIPLHKRRCSRCGHYKPLNAFPRNHRYCKDPCKRELNRLYYLERREQICQYQRDYYRQRFGFVSPDIPPVEPKKIPGATVGRRTVAMAHHDEDAPRAPLALLSTTLGADDVLTTPWVFAGSRRVLVDTTITGGTTSVTAEGTYNPDGRTSLANPDPVQADADPDAAPTPATVTTNDATVLTLSAPYLRFVIAQTEADATKLKIYARLYADS